MLPPKTKLSNSYILYIIMTIFYFAIHFFEKNRFFLRTTAKSTKIFRFFARALFPPFRQREKPRFNRLVLFMQNYFRKLPGYEFFYISFFPISTLIS